MSASNNNSAIYLTDTPEEIKHKIHAYAFSGGRATLKEHRELGADLEVMMLRTRCKFESTYSQRNRPIALCCEGRCGLQLLEILLGG